MVKLWRPNPVDWHNRWGVEDDLNRLMREEGWKVRAVLPPHNDYSGPTFVLENRKRWRDRNQMSWLKAKFYFSYWRLVHWWRRVSA